MAAYTNYFVDMETTITTADATSGDNIISVEAVFFDTSHSLLIAGNTYTISAINNLDVTLNEALSGDVSAGAIIAIDDSSFDGLSPDTAKRTTLFIDGADINNHSRVWIRRKSGFTVESNTDGGKYTEMIVWPYDNTQSKYDIRPQAGIDAGWDNDTDEFSLDVGVSWIGHNGSEDAIVSYENMKIDSQTADAIPCFLKKGGDISFINCDITNNRTNVNTGPFIRMQPHGASNVHLTGSTYRSSGTNSSLVGISTSDDFNFEKNIYIENSEIISDGLIFHAYSTAIRKYQNNNSVYISDSNVACYIVMRHSANDAYINGYNAIGISNSIVRAKNILTYYTSDRYYGMSPLLINVDSSDIETTDTMFNYYSVNISGHESNGYREWRLRDSRLVSAGNLISYNNSNDSSRTASRQYGDISFKRCEVHVAGNNVLYTNNIPNLGRFVYMDNKTMSCKTLVTFSGHMEHDSFVAIKDTHFVGNLIEGVDNIAVDLSNVVIDGLITDSNVSNESVDGNNIQCTGFEGFGSYRLENSLLDSINLSDIVPNAASAVMKGCIIDSHGANIADSYARDITFIDCDITGELLQSNVSNRTIFNSKLNNTDISYFNSSSYTNKEISPIFRVGGSDGTIKLSGMANDIRCSQSIKTLSGELAVGASSVVLYFATPIVLSSLNKFGKIRTRYIDIDGVVALKEMIISGDTASSWDGIQNGTNTYRASCDVVNSNRPIGDDKSVVIEFEYYPDEDEPYGDIYIDMNLAYE